MIETPCDFTGHLNVRYLILTDRHAIGAIYQDIGGLHQWITKKPIGGEVMATFAKLLHLVFIRWYTFQPG